MLLAALGIVGSIASVVGVYALYDARKNRRVKLLAFERTGSLPLAAASSVERSYKLSIHYRPPDAEDDEEIEAAYVTYLRFANFGKEPVRREDIAPASPLRVEITGARVLDISLSSIRREVTRLHVEPPRIGELEASANVTFDFLDYHDGGVIRILSTGRRCKAELAGEIIGMPGGILRSDEAPARGLWGKLGFGLWLAAELAAFGGAAYVVNVVAGSWSDAWLLLLPLVAFLLPVVGAFLVSETVWPSGVRKYPDELSNPRWLDLRRGIGIGTPPPPYMAWWDEQELSGDGDEEQSKPSSLTTSSRQTTNS
jgi:hypothetical protein